MSKILCAVFIALSLLTCSAACTSAPPTPASETSESVTVTKIANPTVTPTATPISTVTVEKSSDGVIVFYSNRDGNPEIYTINADGSSVTRLTNDPGFDDSPAISPDGEQVIFLTARHDPDPKFPNLKYEIYGMDIDGKNLLRLTNTEAGEDHPAWSPTGNRILFDADYDGDGFYEIYTMAPDGTDLTRLTSGESNDQFADWSPDGDRIAFASDRNGNWDIYVMDVDGTHVQPLTESPNWELFPAWSPDGTQIAFNGLRPNSRNTDVYVMNKDGSDVRQLTNTPGFDENPAWSPDGQQIAFQTNRDGNFEIYVMAKDGSNQHLLAAHPADALWPSWGPMITTSTNPGTAIAFVQSDQVLGLRETYQAGLGNLDGDGDLDALVVNSFRDTGFWPSLL